MRKFISVILSITILFATFAVSSASSYDINCVLNNTAKMLYKTVSNPQVSSIGGEWTVFGLARSGLDIPHEYFENYYQTVLNYVKERGGVLHNKKYTEYSRVIIALTAIGKNPQDVAGYNLLTPLGDYEKTLWQGVNGAIWALMALDSKNYEIPQNPHAKVQATREMYIEHILKKQTSDGGWALSGDEADPDVTGMALQALSKYQDNENVKAAIQKALECLSNMQAENGGFLSYNTENSESIVQVMVALCELGIPIDDGRFVKNGNSVLDSLLTYYDSEKGFKHIYGDSTNLMATEQCFYALVALKRANEGNNSLYNMNDAKIFNDVSNTFGLANKHTDVKRTDVINWGKTFDDIAGHKEKDAIEALALRGIINGKSQNSFEPESTMTRAEFATIITRGLGLPQKSSEFFSDVKPGDWYRIYVNTAYEYGIVKGVSENEFNPNGTITREEAAVMVARAANLCGMDTALNTVAVRDILAQFFDYVLCSDWSQSSLAFCYSQKIMDDTVTDIKPKEAVTRAEIAYMLYNMLLKAKLV